MSEKRFPLVLGLDLEGVNSDILAGLDLRVDRVTEIGAVLWDWRFAQPVKMFSELIDEPDRLAITAELEELTGLSEDLLKRHAHRGDQIPRVLEQLAGLVERADYLMAHNAKGYDRPMLEAMFQRYNMEMPGKVWIDTQTDIEFPSKIRSLSMAGLEHSHGFINPFPHRAVTDTLSMLKVACRYNIDRMVKLARSPIIQIAADFKAPNWKDSHQVEQFNVIKNKVAKSRFRWDPGRKLWIKKIHKVLLDEGKIKFDFEWRVLDS